MFVAADQETYPIRHRAIAPKLVCLTTRDARRGSRLIGNDDPRALSAELRDLFENHETAWHGGAFDLVVATVFDSSLIPFICNALNEGRVRDTKVREKMRNLASHGNLRMKVLPNGVAIPLRYDLASLVKHYLKKDRSGQKGSYADQARAAEDTDSEDPRGDLWRYNYDSLDGWPGSKYPEAAALYAKEDAEDVFDLFPLQEGKLQGAYRSQGLPYPRRAEALHVASAYYLYLISALGIDIDLKAVAKLKAQVDADLSDENLSLLIASGCLRPSKPAKESNQRAHDPITCKKVVTGKKSAKCDCPHKITAPKKSTVCKAYLHTLIEEVCAAHEMPVVRTEPSETFPEGQVSAGADVLADIGELHPVLEQYKFKVSMDKLRDVEIPRMSASPVHPHYDEFKASSRTSCSATKLYPSGNVQNVDPRARGCYVPAEGNYFCSVDVSGMELVTLAQRIYDLFGYSTLREQLNAGMDAHSFLGAQLALTMVPAFRERCKTAGAKTRDQQYALFRGLKAATDPADVVFYDTYRTWAKPTGLGYPGGLGPDTFMVYAKAQYKVKIPNRDVAVLLREVWHETYPEMREYFAWIKNGVRDHENTHPETDSRGKVYLKQRFWYTSPLGTLRRGCSFTETANGYALQTPGAELAKLGLVRVCQAAFDPSLDSILLGRCRPVAFIHDEVLSEVVADETAHDVAEEKGRLMVEGGQLVVPDVLLKVEKKFMFRWAKEAKTVFDENGRLAPWKPKC